MGEFLVVAGFGQEGVDVGGQVGFLHSAHYRAAHIQVHIARDICQDQIQLAINHGRLSNKDFGELLRTFQPILAIRRIGEQKNQILLHDVRDHTRAAF